MPSSIAPPDVRDDRLSRPSPAQLVEVLPAEEYAEEHSSIAFYEQLGLEVDDTYEQDGRMRARTVWRRLRRAGTFAT